MPPLDVSLDLFVNVHSEPPIHNYFTGTQPPACWPVQSNWDVVAQPSFRLGDWCYIWPQRSWGCPPQKVTLARRQYCKACWVLLLLKVLRVGDEFRLPQSVSAHSFPRGLHVIVTSPHSVFFCASMTQTSTFLSRNVTNSLFLAILSIGRTVSLEYSWAILIVSDTAFSMKSLSTSTSTSDSKSV